MKMRTCSYHPNIRLYCTINNLSERKRCCFTWPTGSCLVICPPIVSHYFALLLDDFIYRNSKLSNSLICQPSVKEIVVLALLFVLKDKGLFIFHQSVKAFRDTSTVDARVSSSAGPLTCCVNTRVRDRQTREKTDVVVEGLRWLGQLVAILLSYHILLVSHFVPNTHQFAQHDCHLHISDYI